MENIFPLEVRNAVEGIKSETRQRIVSELVLKGKVSYSDLKQRLNTKSKGSFNYHLSSLLNSGLVSNFIMKDNLKDYTSYYEISEFGKSFINSLLASTTYMVPKEELEFNDLQPSQTQYQTDTLMKYFEDELSLDYLGITLDELREDETILQTIGEMSFIPTQTQASARETMQHYSRQNVPLKQIMS
ncbi:MAG: hypothetical protein GWN01_01845 [Nitrosopumilaceae archaeon]|nr:helix-turn-helix transcriptional regulator [Nitrosopumilaceae archaeon]NIT99715.1 helix-turn-helix transcriptional regulator [Nitrosopumilaceae archaeon]NIU88576.1 hypothetical protein [Nitrosopumilaceae archaeon]NIV64850.1 hypothetical protein [Nitrosopumilaceae archaeon]NIX60318.1 hypothetical protein [Nitrosopumilaceae archaeon]